MAATSEGYFAHLEYAAFWDDPEIGNFHSKDLGEVFVVLIAHELAHFVNYTVRKGSRWSGQMHDAIWRQTYRILRRRLLAAYRSGAAPSGAPDRAPSEAPNREADGTCPSRLVHQCLRVSLS